MTKVMQKVLLLLLVVAVTLTVAQPADAGRKMPWTKFKYPMLGEIAMPDYTRVELENGMVLYLAEDHEFPTIGLSAKIMVGSIYEPADKVGLAGITGEVLRSGGTKSWDGDEIDLMLESMGASVETWIGGNTGGAWLSALTEDSDLALQVLAEILTTPQFAEDKIDLSITQHKAGISRRNDEPSSIARREMTKILLGEDHPNARVEEYDTIGSITRDDLVNFHSLYFHPDRMHLIVVGDFDSDTMVAKIEAAFAGWEKSTTPLPNDPMIPNFPRTVNIAAKEGLTQSQILLGHKGIRADHPKYAHIVVANKILGGGFSSRLFNEVRSKRGLAYSTWSSSGTGFRNAGNFMAGVGTKCETTEEAITVVLGEIERMTTELVSQEELDSAKDGILNSEVFSFDTKREVLNRMVMYEMYGYPDNFLQVYQQQVRETTVEDVLAATQELWKPNRLSILAVGDPELFDGDLGKFGMVNDIDITIPEPKLTLDIPTATDESMAAGQAIMTAGYEAMGGKKIGGMNGYFGEMSLDLEIQGMALTFGVEKTIVYPNQIKLAQKTPFGNMVQALDVDVAWADTPGGIVDIEGDDIKGLLEEIEKDFYTVLRNRSDISCQAIDQAEVDGVLCDRVYVTGIGENFILYCFDAETHLLVMDQTKGADMVTGAPVVAKTMYSDYAAIDGVQVAQTIVILHDDEQFAAGTVSKFERNPKLEAGFFSKP